MNAQIRSRVRQHPTIGGKIPEAQATLAGASYFAGLASAARRLHAPVAPPAAAPSKAAPANMEESTRAAAARSAFERERAEARRRVQAMLAADAAQENRRAEATAVWDRIRGC